KIINKAHDLGEQPLVLADRLAKAFFKDMKELHVDSVNLYAKASDHIPEIIDQVTGLLKKGIAYRVDDDVYFDISKFPGYGKLSHQKLEDLTVHRVDPDPRKKHPGDFALWKSQKPGEIFWESPLGFTEEALQQAVSLARRFRRAHDQLALARDRMTGKKGEANSVLNQLDEARDEFFKAMDDDFNTPGALAAYIRMVGLAEEEARNPKTESVNAIISALEDLGSVLGVLETETVAQDRVSE